MAIGTSYYGDLSEADALFLHASFTKSAWTDAVAEDHPKALWAATQIIDTLN